MTLVRIIPVSLSQLHWWTWGQRPDFTQALSEHEVVVTARYNWPL